jgi:ABC-type polar amino acid transport system ATPase subunit
MSVTIEHETNLSRPDAASVTLRGVRKSFGAKTVLSDVDLHVPSGQFVAVVGRSGCGKSTLLRLIAGLDEPTAGAIEVKGASEGRARAEHIMFQEPRLLPWARVDANVAIGLGPVAHAEALHRSREALATVGLVDRADEWPSILSGGQKQRVALARALVSAPRILALDEPLGALDALTRIEMQRLERERQFDLMLKRRQRCCKRSRHKRVGVSRVQSRRPKVAGVNNTTDRLSRWQVRRCAVGDCERSSCGGEEAHRPSDFVVGPAD